MSNLAPRPVVLSWSSGKDSAWTLHALRQDATVKVVGLLTTLNEEFDRVSVHSVRRELLEAQARAAGLRLWVVTLPHPCPNEQYEAAMGQAVERMKAAGVESVAFGDLFLEDIRRYREEKMAGSGMGVMFPLWGRRTIDLAREMLGGGLRARITCVDPRRLDRSFAGREWDEALLEELPLDVDPCGENGEFHTFAYAGPMFEAPIRVAAGEVIERDGFVYADVLPGDAVEEGEP